jgi:hypothetical protein
MGGLLNLIPGVAQAKMGVLIAVAVAFLGMAGTIGYLKIENGGLENTILKKQNLLDNANDVIRQEKEANQTLVRTIEQLKTQITQIIREQQNARATDQNVQAVKDKNAHALEEKMDVIVKDNKVKTDDYDTDRESFLKKYNEDLECRRANPEKLTACQ